MKEILSILIQFINGQVLVNSYKVKQNALDSTHLHRIKSHGAKLHILDDM